MVEIPIPVKANLDRGIRKTYLDTVFATEDDKAHRFDVALYRGNEPVTLPSGASVSAYFIRYSDNGTLPLMGAFSGNVASVTLTKACYNKSGAFALIIKVIENGVTSTVFYGEGSMFVSRTDTLIDDENIIPSLDELLAMVAVMENATAKATTATNSASAAAQSANAAAQKANTEAAAAQGWADATATVETLEAGENADVILSTAASGAKVLEFYFPRGESGVYVGNEEPTDPTVQVWIDPDGEADELPSGVTTEELRAAVNAYLDAHPVTSGATAQEAAQIQKNKEDIEELKQSGTGGISEQAKNLLISILRNAVFTSDQSANITALKTALNASEEPGIDDSGEPDGGGADAETTTETLNMIYATGYINTTTGEYTESATAKQYVVAEMSEGAGGDLTVEWDTNTLGTFEFNIYAYDESGAYIATTGKQVGITNPYPATGDAPTFTNSAGFGHVNTSPTRINNIPDGYRIACCMRYSSSLSTSPNGTLTLSNATVSEWIKNNVTIKLTYPV